MRKSGMAMVVLAAVLAGTLVAAERVYKDEKGRILMTPMPVAAKWLNPTTPAYEEELIERNQKIIAQIGAGSKGAYGNLYFENEKNTYPVAMTDFLAGNRERALRVLQMDDTEGYNSYTKMVDFFPCFTLKGQVRKYFFFGEYLTPEYRQKMLEGAKIFTASDPLKRQIPGQEVTPKTRGVGWMPSAVGAAVDTRNTDNLRAMRDVSVYLFAEASGNEEVRKIYKEKIRTWVTTFYNVGNGEWDSNNYLSHTFTGYIGLYDFAQDPEVKGLGKACLDLLATSAAVKYWHGDFGGPSKRDYGGKLPFGCNAAVGYAYYFGDYVEDMAKGDRDDVHQMTSAYRPPPAVLALARKQFTKPVEILASKPVYDILRMTPEAGPESFETQYIANTYQLGSLANGSSDDMNGFKLMTANCKRGTDDLYISSAPGAAPKSLSTGTDGGESIAQYKNMAIILNPKGAAKFNIFLPKSAEIKQAGAITFIKFEKTWLALQPINSEWKGVDEAVTQAMSTQETKDKKGVVTGSKATTEAGEQIAVVAGKGGNYAGMVLELGEQETHGDFAAFCAAVTAKSKLDASLAGSGSVSYAGALGETVAIKAQGGLPEVTRNGKVHDWKQHYALWQDGATKAPVTLGWKTGKLKVEAGGKVFEASLDKAGAYTFSNR